MQTRLGSIIETVTNIGTGFVISMVINSLLLPAMGYQITTSQNLVIVSIFTGVSVIRSYFFRRFFNWIAVRYKF